MKRLTFVIPLLMSVACSRDNTAPRAGTTGQGQAMVRFVNADPQGSSLDLWFGDSKAFSGVSYKGASAYTWLPAERKEFHLRTAGQNSDLTQNSEGLTAGRHYTVVAVRHADGKVSLRMVEDDLKAPEAGKAKVRIMNVSPGAGELDVYATAKKDEVFEDVDFEDTTAYKEVDPSAGTLEIRQEDKKVPLVLPDMKLEPNKLYTIVVTGQQPIEAVRLSDSHESSSGQTAVR